MKNWRTTISGSCAALGTFLIGGAVLSNWTSVHLPGWFATTCAVTGFLCQGLGIFFAAFFAPDSKQMENLNNKVDLTTAAILNNDTSILKKSTLKP